MQPETIVLAEEPDEEGQASMRHDRQTYAFLASLVGAVVAGAVLVAATPAPWAAAAGTPCASLASDAFSGAKVSGARLIAADPAKALPAYCEVTAIASSTPGSHIGVILRLPEGWNGKLLGVGGGGWAGNVTLDAAAEGLAKGYAVAETDTGHPSPNALDMSWALAANGGVDQDAMTDFGWRAVHLMTVFGKQVLGAYYGKAPAQSYFQGCSTGGRQGMMEAQRFPDDYDGVISGDPVYDYTVQTSAVVRTQIFHADPESNLEPAQAELLNKAVLEACDGLDGLKDGIVTDPRVCRFDPKVLQCKPGQAPPQCLTAKQTDTVSKAYAGLKTADGRVVAWPLMRGGELDWIGRSIGNPRAPLGLNAALGSRALQVAVYADPQRNLMSLSPEAMLRDIAASPYTPVYEAKDPDISKFAARGGKLLLYHGIYDPGPSVLGTIKYFEAARAAMGRRSGQAQLFLVPGMYHCRGGPGPDRFDSLDALDRWVTTSAPPKMIPAANAGSGLQRPLCPYPALAAYVGKGDPKALASFACRAHGRHGASPSS